MEFWEWLTSQSEAAWMAVTALLAFVAIVISIVSMASAAKSAKRAEKAQSEALEAWRSSARAAQSANDSAKWERRAQFAQALGKMGRKMITARLSGESETGIYPERSEDVTRLDELQFVTPHPSVRKLTRWVGEFAITTPISGPQSAIEATAFLSDRVRDWVDAPDDTMSAIRNDPRVPSKAVNPTDKLDWRNE